MIPTHWDPDAYWDISRGATRPRGVPDPPRRGGNGLSERSIIYSGLRGVGKAVLLIEFDMLAREAGWVSTDVHEVGSQADFRTAFSETAFRLLLSMSRRERMGDRAKAAFGVLKAFSIAAPAASRED